ATGMVVVASAEKGAVGETMNLASRLQSIAPVNTVVVSERVKQLTAGAFDYEDLGEQTLKGISAPTHAYRILRISDTASRFEAAHGESLTPLVGRDLELGMLMDRWAHAQEGEGQVVLLCGEPGIGKSRILHELCTRIETEPHKRLHYQCSPYHTGSALFPVIEQLGRAAGFGADDDDDTKLHKLEALVSREGKAPALFAALMGIKTGELYEPLNLSPRRMKEETLHAIASEIERMSLDKPVLIVFEDVHWIDPTTQETLDLIVGRVAERKVLLVISYRPEYSPPWSADHRHIRLLDLSRLEHEQATAMIGRITIGKTLPSVIVDQIVSKTDGVPLFVEELTKTVLESGIVVEENGAYRLTDANASLILPSTLQDSLMARLDRLSWAKEVAQIAACIGREFAYPLLASVSGLSESRMNEALPRLLESKLLHYRKDPFETTYVFKHALVRDAAYSSLLKSRRRDIHAAIARTLEREKVVREAKPELIAHHFTEAKLIEQAIPYWLEAGKLATARSANSEALEHLNRGLSLTSGLADSPGRNRRELEFLVASTTPIIGSLGWGTSELDEATSRAMTLCETVQDVPLVSRSLYMQWGYGTWTGRHVLARQAAEKQVRLGKEAKDEVALLVGYGLLGRVQCYLGELEAGRRNMEQSLVLYDPSRHGWLALQYGQDPAMAAYGGLAWCLWVLGCPEDAHEAKQNCLRMAEISEHPHTRCYALAVVASFYGFFALSADELESLATRLQEIIEQQSMWHWAGVADCALGKAQADRGDFDRALRLMNTGLRKSRAAGMEQHQALLLSQIAAACLHSGRMSEGLDAIDEALARGRRAGERCFEPELLRLKGELLLRTARSPSQRRIAVSFFEHGLEVSKQTRAGMLSLRCASSWVNATRDCREGEEAQKALDLACRCYPGNKNHPQYLDARELLHSVRKSFNLPGNLDPQDHAR
ncbi:MAG: AAA family ATPase, partial [Betaproteobacteria bacterium]